LAPQQELVDEVESLASRCRTHAEERAELEDQVAHLETALADLLETQERQVESLTDCVDELESTFTAEEARAIREVIAAERVWRKHRADAQRPRMTPATGAGDR
jgi:predicted  nucleic acid-binding Zn-ribbon protein